MLGRRFLFGILNLRRATRKVTALGIGICLKFGICHLEFSLLQAGSKNQAKNIVQKRRFWTPYTRTPRRFGPPLGGGPNRVLSLNEMETIRSMKAIFKRTWISPLAAVCFTIVAFTGILMLLHIKNGPIVNLHQWIGLLFAIAGIIHLSINWRGLLSCFRQKAAAWPIIAVLILSLILMIVGPNQKHGQAGNSWGHEYKKMGSHGRR